MDFLEMTKPIEPNDKTRMDFHHPLPCALFLDWAIYCRLENAEMLLQVWYRFFSTLMIHVEFIKTLFPE